MFDCTIPEIQPRKPIEGERIYIYGAPQGQSQVSSRIARVYLKRSTASNIAGEGGFSTPTWIARIDEMPLVVQPDTLAADNYGPVAPGMSGGMIISKRKEPLGVLVMATSPADLNHNGINEQYCDFVSLHDIWQIFATTTHNIA